MKTIKIFGEDVKIAFNIACQICYEKVTDKAFDLVDLAKAENRMALYFAVIVTNNEETNITIEKLIREASFDDIKTIDTAVNEAVSEWYQIPKPAQVEQNAEEEDEDKQKNV